MAIKGVASDLEGPGVNVEKLHFDGFIHAAQVVFHQEIDFPWIIRHVPFAIGGGDVRIAQGIALSFGNAEAADPILKEKRAYYEHALTDHVIAARPGYIEMLATLKCMGLPIAIGSLTPSSQARTLLGRTSIGLQFKLGRVVLLEDVGEHRKKPHPEVYLETARRMGIAPEEQLVIEDSETGLLAARAAGSIAIAAPIFWFPENIAKLVAAGARRFIHDWREVSIETLIGNLNVDIA